MDRFMCGRCKLSKADDDFAPSQRRNGAWCRQCFREWYLERNGGMQTRLCDQCGAEMLCTGRRAAEPRVFCSRKCKEDRTKAELKAKTMQSKPDRWCRHCGSYMPKSMRADAEYCSDNCNHSAHMQTRKASKKLSARQERIDRGYIIERDGGRCHLCGKRPKGDELTIDHIVPLSKGGRHVAENLAVACKRCNLSKGSRAANDQLLLVG